jgi:hypothetical protein
VRELETRNAVDRKKLIQTISQYLNNSGVKSRLNQEPDLKSSDINVTDSFIQVEDQAIDSIRLIRRSSLSCGDDRDVLRFQFRIRLDKELPKEVISKLKAETKTVREGKVLKLFGGKVSGVKWIGQELAETLNRHSEISEALFRCTRSWGDMGLDIRAVSFTEISISGPWFTNPRTIIALYSSGKSQEEQDCVLGYKTIDMIARIIRGQFLIFESVKQGEICVKN